MSASTPATEASSLPNTRIIRRASGTYSAASLLPLAATPTARKIQIIPSTPVCERSHSGKEDNDKSTSDTASTTSSASPDRKDQDGTSAVSQGSIRPMQPPGNPSSSSTQIASHAPADTLRASVRVRPIAPAPFPNPSNPTNPTNAEIPSPAATFQAKRAKRAPRKPDSSSDAMPATPSAALTVDEMQTVTVIAPEDRAHVDTCRQPVAEPNMKQEDDAIVGAASPPSSPPPDLPAVAVAPQRQSRTVKQSRNARKATSKRHAAAGPPEETDDYITPEEVLQIERRMREIEDQYLDAARALLALSS